MAKKRGKSKPKLISKKKPIKKQAGKTSEAPKPLKDALHELEVLAESKKIEHKVEDVEKEEESIEKKETEIVKEEKKLAKETEKVENIEKKIARDVSEKPLTSFNFRDLNKGIIGAFIPIRSLRRRTRPDRRRPLN